MAPNGAQEGAISAPLRQVNLRQTGRQTAMENRRLCPCKLRWAQSASDPATPDHATPPAFLHLFDLSRASKCWARVFHHLHHLKSFAIAKWDSDSLYFSIAFETIERDARQS